MAQLNNPAGRLHALLTDFQLASAAGNVSVLNAWREVLATDSQASTLAAVARVAALVPELEVALEATDDQSQVRSFRHFADDWLAPILTPGLHWGQAGGNLVQDTPLVMLGSLSSFLGQLYPEGVVPDSEKQEELRGMVAAALETVRQSDLPDDVKAVMVRRFHDMQWALDHLAVAGPEGVKAAAERLTGTVVLQEPSIRQRIADLGVMDTALYAWVAFSSGPVAQASLESWPQVFQQIAQR
jgi:hypothetical protein